MNLFKSSLDKVYYDIRGNGSKHLLLIHGLGSSSDIFLPQLKYYENEYKIILTDLPGHGRSARLKKFPPDYYSQCADVLIELLKSLKIKDVHIIGLRGGGIIAMNMGIRAPKLVDKIVADSFPGKKISNGNLDLIIDDIERRKKSLFKRYQWKKLHGSDWRDVIDAEINLMEKIKYSDYRIVVPDIDDIKNDVLLTGSARDNLVPPLAPIYAKLKKKYPHFKIVLFKKGSNPAMISNKKRFHEEVYSFLKTPAAQ
jgi:pimeloyl-ACP methyl ester carboxylesterase